MSRGEYSFEQAVWRELDQMREAAQLQAAASQRQAEAIERAFARHAQRDDERDSEMSELRLQVNLLRSECKRNMRRDAGLVIAPTTLVAVITAVLNWLQPAPAALPHPAPSAAVTHTPTGG